jgi:hypothetical protein
VQPSNAVAGQAISPAIQVALEDATGEVVSTANGNVKIVLASNSSGGTLSGNVTVRAVNGVATFTSLVVNKVGSNYTLQATTGSLPAATSAGFAITPGAAARLMFTGQPTTERAGLEIAPPVQVTALDAEGNVATGFTGGVTVGFGAAPPLATLGGTLTRPTIAGVSSFPDLIINSPATGYTLVASAGSFATTSQPFNVNAAPATGIDYHGGPIVYTPKVAALYWSASRIYNGGPSPGTFGSPTADHSLVGLFISSLGGSPFFNILTTYYDSTDTNIQNIVTYTQYWADGNAPPAVPTDADIQAEIESGLTNGALTYDPSTTYAVFTGTGINLGGGFGTSYCGYHSFFFDGMGRDVKYAAMPYGQDFVATSTVAGCSVFGVVSPNNDLAADGEVSVLAHELAEVATDENLDAWFVASGPNAGEEMADLCLGSFGTLSSAQNGAPYNQVLAGTKFLVQMLWVNALNAQSLPVGCQQEWTTPPPAAGPRIRPSRVTLPRTQVLDRRHIMRPFHGPNGLVARAQ